jgi:1,6-anhydro-N-acetylmuramate kinase
VAEVARLNFLLGELFADAALRVLESCNLQPHEVDLIGSHGQTICHLPGEGITLQIGEPSVIAERTGITTVADFVRATWQRAGKARPWCHSSIIWCCAMVSAIGLCKTSAASQTDVAAGRWSRH